MQVFQGEAGAVQLDFKGERHGGWVQFRRGLERLIADETTVFDRAEELLRSGGVVVAAFTGGDAALKDRAVDVLKSHGGQPVRYWGEWTVDRREAARHRPSDCHGVRGARRPGAHLRHRSGSPRGSCGDLDGMTAVCDIGPRSIEAMVADATARLGGIDVLVNNAGIAGPTAPVQQVDADKWEGVLQVNLTGTFLVTKRRFRT